MCLVNLIQLINKLSHIHSQFEDCCERKNFTTLLIQLSSINCADVFYQRVAFSKYCDGCTYQGTLVLWTANQDKALSFQISRFCAGCRVAEDAATENFSQVVLQPPHCWCQVSALPAQSCGKPTLAYLLLQTATTKTKLL